MTVTACVDCGITVMGERLRCPACHDRCSAALQGAVVLEGDSIDGAEFATFAIDYVVIWALAMIGTWLLVIAIARWV